MGSDYPGFVCSETGCIISIGSNEFWAPRVRVALHGRVHFLACFLSHSRTRHHIGLIYTQVKVHAKRGPGMWQLCGVTGKIVFDYGDFLLRLHLM